MWELRVLCGWILGLPNNFSIRIFFFNIYDRISIYGVTFMMIVFLSLGQKIY